MKRCHNFGKFTFIPDCTNNARNGQFQCDDQAQAEATESVHHVDLSYEFLDAAADAAYGSCC